MSERVRELESPRFFVDRLEDALTTPEASPAPPPVAPSAPELDPLDAVKGAVLGGDLDVLGDLGSGANARVFKVRHPREGELALKVPLSDAHDDRIAREGEVLARLRRTAGGDRIAHLVDVRTLAGRTCLLVQLAGDRTLADEIRAEGALSLDYAHRWGDDLPTALRSLEEAGVQHRDIKPANIGLTSGAEKGKTLVLKQGWGGVWERATRGWVLSSEGELQQARSAPEIERVRKAGSVDGTVGRLLRQREEPRRPEPRASFRRRIMRFSR